MANTTPNFSEEYIPPLSYGQLDEGIDLPWDINIFPKQRFDEKDLENIFNRGTTEKRVQAIAGLVGQDISKKNAIALRNLATGYDTDPAIKYLAQVALLETRNPENIKLAGEIFAYPSVIGAVCAYLINNPIHEAFPYLEQIVKSGQFESKCYALAALGFSNSPTALSLILTNAEKEFNDFDYVDMPKTPRSLSFLNILSVVAESWDMYIRQIRLGFTFVDGTVDLDELSDEDKIPKPARLLYNYHMRISALKMLLLSIGSEHGYKYLETARHSIHKTLLASALIYFENLRPIVVTSLVQGLKANHFAERLIAYESFIHLEKETAQQEYANYAISGLNDRDETTRVAVANAIIAQGAERLYPQALAKASSPKENERMGIIPSVQVLAEQGNPLGQKVAEQLQKDSSKKVREMFTLYKTNR